MRSVRSRRSRFSAVAIFPATRKINVPICAPPSVSSSAESKRVCATIRRRCGSTPVRSKPTTISPTHFFNSADFPTLNAFQAKLAGPANGFVTSLDDTGQLLYSTYLGGSGYDEPAGFVVDPIGNVYLGGWTSSADFPLVNPSQSTFGGGFSDAFLAKISPGRGR